MDNTGSYSSSVSSNSSPSHNAYQSSENSAKKICLVCGDKALGYNFNAITCESCKAFFRRNALKQKIFKCPFRDNCEITVLSRRFCQKCRLRKCLEVGMLTDLIMTTRNGEKDGGVCGGLKIRKRRRHRHSPSSCKSGVGCPCGGPNPMYPIAVIDPRDEAGTNPDGRVHADQPKSRWAPIQLDDNFNASSTFSQYNFQCPVKREVDVDRWHNFAQFYTYDATPMPFECYDYKYDWKESNFSSADETAIDNKEETCLYNLDDRKYSVISAMHIKSEIDYQQGGMHRSVSRSNSSGDSTDDNGEPIDDLINGDVGPRIESDHAECQPCEEWPRVVEDFSSGLSAWKLFRLEELLSANEVVAVPSEGPPISFADFGLAEHMGEVCVRKCTQVSRRIQAFKDLTVHDQIMLLKSAALELVCIRGIMVYQSHLDCWRPVGFPFRLLPLDCTPNHNSLRNFYALCPEEWRTNDPIMLCLSAIVLFDPTRENLRDTQTVRLQQLFYCDLLKEYLQSVFPNADLIYWRAIQLLNVMRQRILKLQPILDVKFDPRDMEVVSVVYDWRSTLPEDERVTITPLN